MDIEQINLVSDDEDDVVITGSGVARNKGKGRATAGHMMKPIRLTRHEHKERVVLVNTDSSADAPKVEEDEDIAKEEEDEDEGLFVSQDGTVVKPEPADMMDVDGVPAALRRESIDLDAIPAAPRRESIDLDAIPPPLTADEVAAEKERRAKRKSLAAKNKKPVLQTEEDKAEYARHLEDIEILSRELAGLRAEPAGGDGDVEMGEDGQPIVKEKVDAKEGRLYLFQFPPILPKLRNLEKPVKPDPGALDADTELSDIPAAGTPVDLTGTPDIKAEPAAGAEIEVVGAGTGAEAGGDVLVQEPGLIGKLVVRKSGKVELSWGGTSLALNKGSEFDFLTTGLVVQGLEKGGKAGREITKEEEGRMAGTGMGRIMGKFVATPDWERLFR
jgi:DNA-directed RNA polymerase III subunit RPC4